jgi:hypothetical protein
MKKMKIIVNDKWLVVNENAVELYSLCGQCVEKPNQPEFYFFITFTPQNVNNHIL